MDADEVAALVDELDLRVERLRVLYDQYFMGIEKIPPEVLKKDVERRMWVLRREKIRNTGTRFRFQQVTQRLNTFQSYWMRICREIENGTYKRDVMRAKKRFGNAPAAQSGVVKKEDQPQSAMDLDDLDIELEDMESEHPPTNRDAPELDEEFPPLFPDTARMSVAPKASPLPEAPPQRAAPPRPLAGLPQRIAPAPPRAPTNTGAAPVHPQSAPTLQSAKSAVLPPTPPGPRVPGAPLGTRIPAGQAAGH
ncbi:MAG: hypothetical protein ABI175_27140, partial [Polyangiales bacterium]